MTQLTKKEIQLWSNRAALAERDPWYWIKYFVFTQDEHDKTVLRKPFPPKAMFRLLCRASTEFDVVFIEKSRQVMMSWFSIALALREVLFQFNRRIFLQSKKQEDADALLNRARHIYDAIRTEVEPLIGKWLPDVKKTGLKSGTSDKMEFPSMGSVLQSIPQGPDIVRSYTSSRIVADEMNHQPQFLEGYAAASPSIQGGGKYWALGTPNGRTGAYAILNGLDDRTLKPIGNHLIDSREISEKLIEPPENLTPEQQRLWIEKYLLTLTDEVYASIPFVDLAAMTPGVEYHKTIDNTDCLRIHYSADPEKDPITVKGAEWVKQAKWKMKSMTKWEREMEISYDTYEGRPVIINWDRNKFVRPLEYDSEYPLRTSHDFGTINCLTFFFQYVRAKDCDAMQLKFLDELVLLNSNTPELATFTVDKIKRDYNRSWEHRNIKSYCDPNGDRQEETTSDKSLNTSIKIMHSFGLFPSNKKFGVPESTELIETVFSMVLPNGEPAILIDPKCDYLISCCAGGLHYPDNNTRPGYYEKDGIYDHGGDAMRYAIANCFTQYDLTGNKPRAYSQTKPIYEKYTGRIIRQNKRILQKSINRGVHRVHSSI